MACADPLCGGLWYMSDPQMNKKNQTGNLRASTDVYKHGHMEHCMHERQCGCDAAVEQIRRLANAAGRPCRRLAMPARCTRRSEQASNGVVVRKRWLAGGLHLQQAWLQACVEQRDSLRLLQPGRLHRLLWDPAVRQQLGLEFLQALRQGGVLPKLLVLWRLLWQCLHTPATFLVVVDLAEPLCMLPWNRSIHGVKVREELENELKKVVPALFVPVCLQSGGGLLCRPRVCPGMAAPLEATYGGISRMAMRPQNKRSPPPHKALPSQMSHQQR